jgi:hypothetical protein
VQDLTPETYDFPLRDHARAAIFDCIELYYNLKRLHQALGYRTPDEADENSKVFKWCVRKTRGNSV